eukprot:Plantae.Rhodophyta-Purpureofilum_apyrenoidigerum.ctg27658.p1 GENE.Plantae.Rhodophyta-Purpureofilum_apyrenoidigerum.ctg27658~~Plantae.Rhodophyta-Purpureofilum_apyrenoidigerum.ctg27658.p1  ORF type:complete len:449 (-),score=106.28 Plantae.Rhodophyta-Purpureofilum_apyrenoidigerum.ctg27658:36-1382(-)
MKARTWVLGTLLLACTAVVCAREADERNALVGDLEETKQMTESILSEKGNNRVDDVLPSDALIEEIKVELARQSRAVDVEEESVKNLKSDYEHIKNRLKVEDGNIATKNATIANMKRTIDREWKQIEQAEDELNKLKENRKKVNDSRNELRQTMGALQTKIDSAKAQISNLSDIRLERWLRGRIDEIGDYLQSPDTSDALTEMLNDAKSLYAKSADSLQQLALEIDSNTHSFFLSQVATSLIIVLPVLLISVIMSRITRFLNLRGLIFIANAALLCYFVVCLALTLMHIDLQYLHKSSHRQLLLIFVLVATMGPLVTMMTFVAGATSSTKRERICFGIEFLVLLIVNGVVAQVQANSRSLLLQPRSTLSVSFMWYAAMSAIMMGNLLLTLFAAPRDRSTLPMTRQHLDTKSSQPDASSVKPSGQAASGAEADVPVLPTTVTSSQDKTD